MTLTNTVEQRLRDAERETDTLRSELEDRRRADDEREQDRREALRRRHPSNRLYNGEIGDFREAMGAHIAALTLEQGKSTGTDEDDVKFRADFDRYIANAKALLAEYEMTIGTVERVLFKLWAADTEKGSTKQIAGQCGLARDYSPLAI